MYVVLLRITASNAQLALIIHRFKHLQRFSHILSSPRGFCLQSFHKLPPYVTQIVRYSTHRPQSPILPCKAKRQYLLTLQVSRYCFLALQCSIYDASSHTRLASPEVVDRGLAESVSKPSIGVGTFKKDFFCLTQV